MSKHKKAKTESGKHAKKHETKHTTKHKTKKPKSSNTLIWVAAIAVIVVAVFFMTRGGEDQPEIDISPGPTSQLESGLEQVSVDFYVMSQCPYGTQVEDAIAPVLSKIGAYVDFNLDFIASDNGDGTFNSLHGQPEVDGNIAQLCAIEHEPTKYMDMIICQNKNPSAIPGNWESCAAGANLDVQKIKTCYEGEEGKNLLRTSLAKAQAVQASGSPTIFIDDVRYQGGRSDTDFMRAICNAIPEKPAECLSIPVCSRDTDCNAEPNKVGVCEITGNDAKCTYKDPVAVDMIVISDKRCAPCEELAARIDGQLKTIMLGLDTTIYDYSDAEGKKLYQELGLTALPAILFNQDVEQARAYTNVQPYLEPVGEYLSLKIGAQFNPDVEICNNGIDDTENGKVDCEDDTCKDSLECREEMESHLQVFIMSDCPYGREAVKALYEVVNNFEDALDFEIHYIAGEQGDGFSSLHGQYEVDENIVQLCTLEHSPDEWFEYVNCRSVNGVKGVDWKTCAEETGVDTNAVQTCFDGDEGANLLREDIKIANSLGVSASPTWFANNRYKFSGIAAEPVKQSFCQYNPDIEGCENTLTATAAAPAGACG